MYMTGTVRASEADDPKGALDNRLAVAEHKAEGLRGTLSKTQEALMHLHEMMLPDAEAPKDLEGLVGAFHSSDEAIKGFSYAQTERGVRSFLAIALAHGTQVDFDAITTKNPVGTDGKPKSTRKYVKTAGRLAGQFFELIRDREAEKVKTSAEKSAAVSESGAA